MHYYLLKPLLKDFKTLYSSQYLQWLVSEKEKAMQRGNISTVIINRLYFEKEGGGFIGGEDSSLLNFARCNPLLRIQSSSFIKRQKTAFNATKLWIFWLKYERHSIDGMLHGMIYSSDGCLCCLFCLWCKPRLSSLLPYSNFIRCIMSLRPPAQSTSFLLPYRLLYLNPLSAFHRLYSQKVC